MNQEGFTIAVNESQAYTFTVFTPTYNRVHTLPRVYESLYQQTFRDFEWVIVDDGSTDGTHDYIQALIGAAPFPIRYFAQPNQGKHIAHNRGVREARGRFFLPLDSDDACHPQALQRFFDHWNSIPPESRERFTGVTGRCADENGRVIGDRFPLDVLDSNSLEIRYKYRIHGEKWGFHRTEVLREFPFPEIKIRNVPEGIVWSAIARKYQTRFVNDILRIYYISDQSLIHAADLKTIAPSARMEHQNCLDRHIDYFWYAPLQFIKSGVHYSRFSFHAGISSIKQIGELHSIKAKAIGIVTLPIGLMVYWRDRLTAGRAP